LKVMFLSYDQPISNNPMSTVFINERIRVLKKYMDEYCVLYFSKQYSSLLKFYKRTIMKEKSSDESTNDVNKDILWKGIEYRFGAYDWFIENKMKVNEKRLHRLYEQLICSIDIEKYDFIHAHTAYPMGYVGKLIKDKYKKPLIITCHGSDIHTAPFESDAIKRMTLDALNTADKVIFVSKALQSTAKTLGYDGNNAVVIPNGVNTKLFTIEDRKMRKKELELRGNVVGFIGNLNYVKRADKFPMIFNEIKKLNPDVEFLILGDGKYRKQMINAAKKFNLKIHCLGIVSPERVPYYLNAMNTLILPSRMEGFPCVIFEAFACGVPVIGSNAGGIPEALNAAGTMVEEGTEFERRFATAVNNTLMKETSREALREIALRNSWETMGEAEYRIYKSMLKL
jgi:teichuronic acid biosynthesis glycosyltransferase TuaC